MAIQSVIQVAELIVIPTRPSPHDLRAVGATVDLCERAGKPLIFVVNGATPKAKITYEAAVALSQHGTVAPVTIHHRTDFAASMIDGRTVMEVDPKARSASEITELWDYIADRLEKNFRRTVFSAPGQIAQPAHPASRVRLRPPRDRPVREAAMNEARPFASLSSGLLARKGAARPAMRPQGFGPHQRLRGSRLERHGRRARATISTSEMPEHVPSSISALTPAPKAAPRPRTRPSPRWSPSSARSPRASPPRPSPSRRPSPAAGAAPVEAPSAVVALPRRPAAAAARPARSPPSPCASMPSGIFACASPPPSPAGRRSSW